MDRSDCLLHLFELTSARAGPGFGVCNVHIFAIPDHEGVAKTLGDVGSAVGAEAEPLFRDKDELVRPREPLGGGVEGPPAGRARAASRPCAGLVRGSAVQLRGSDSRS